MTADNWPMRFITLSALTTFVAVGACQCDELSVVPGGLNGRVCDVDTGLGIAGAAVKLSNGRETLSDANGDYVFARVPPGKVDITATIGELERTFHAKVQSDKNSVVTDTACREQPTAPSGGVVEGDVCNRHTGAIVSDADVTIARADGEIMLTTTDADGHFAMANVPEGNHVVVIDGANFRRSLSITVREGETTLVDLSDDCEVPTAAEGSIAGRACDPSDSGVSATVTITRLDDALEATDDVVHDVADLDDGSFFVGALQPGTWDVLVAFPAHELRARVEVIAGQTANVDDPVACGDDMQLGRLEGELCNTDLGGLFVGDVALLDPVSDAVVVTTSTDPGGHFQLEQLDPGTYSLRLTRDGFSRTIAPVIVQAFQTTFLHESDCPTPEQCHEATVLPQSDSDGRILLVVDRSGSMSRGINADGSGDSKYNVLKNTLGPVLDGLNDTVELGLMLYPRPSGNECSAGSLEVALGLNKSQTIQNELDNVGPNGSTPTAPTLADARGVLQPLVADGRPIAVLLATDGAPNCNGDLNPFTCVCSDPNGQGQCGNAQCLDDDNTIGAVGDLKDMGVQTYVLGLPGVENFHDVLDNMALVGGTARTGQLRKYYPASSQALLAEALEAITTRVLECRIELGEDLSAAGSVSVSIDGTAIVRDTARQNGWDMTSPTVVELFGSACDAAVAGNSTTVEICD